MADLGTIGVRLPSGTRARAITGWWTAPSSKRSNRTQRLPLPVWAADARKLISIDRSGTFTGTVSEDGTPLSSVLVRLYYRPTGALINATLCSAVGTFSFTGLETGLNIYYVIAFDPDGGTLYNAQILDRIAPV